MRWVMIGWTIPGDAEPDGTASFEELAALAQEYETGGQDWVAGDFSYDGGISFEDLATLSQNYGTPSP